MQAYTDLNRAALKFAITNPTVAGKNPATERLKDAKLAGLQSVIERETEKFEAMRKAIVDGKDKSEQMAAARAYFGVGESADNDTVTAAFKKKRVLLASIINQNVPGTASHERMSALNAGHQMLLQRE